MTFCSAPSPYVRRMQRNVFKPQRGKLTQRLSLILSCSKASAEHIILHPLVVPHAHPHKIPEQLAASGSPPPPPPPIIHMALHLDAVGA